MWSASSVFWYLDAEIIDRPGRQIHNIVLSCGRVRCVGSWMLKPLIDRGSVSQDVVYMLRLWC